MNIICWETQVTPAKPTYSCLIQLKTMRVKSSEFVHLIYFLVLLQVVFFIKKLNKNYLVKSLSNYGCENLHHNYL